MSSRRLAAVWTFNPYSTPFSQQLLGSTDRSVPGVIDRWDERRLECSIPPSITQSIASRAPLVLCTRHRIEAPQNSRCNTAAGTLCTRVNRTGVHGASPRTLDDGALGRGIGGRGEEGERTGCRIRVRDREMGGFHIMRSPGFSQRRDTFSCGVWRKHRNKTRETEKHALGAEKKRDHVALWFFDFVASSIEDVSARARQRGDGAKPTLGSEKVRWVCVAWQPLVDLCV